MKKILYLSFIALFFACNTTQKPEPVNIADEELAIEKVFETLNTSIVDRNIDQLASVFADDGIFLGTNPDELFTKDSIIKMWTHMMKLPEMPPFEPITETLIRIHPDGNTAVVAQQYYWKLFTTLPLRQTFWMVKKDSVWLIDFFEFSFIPYDEQVPALNEAVKEEE